ncbi:hypothetical protein [Halapricum salinum]|uniref:Zinc finger PHD-type domain-containing protein n=1 Tax=Halapricum salinum TaxID=1457250 RepID=A0A4D6H9C2_9EURY|nr:hypothetical protein [Halapricum salinum]QCC50111.1 hypothetical protein DV733_02215 [Halapricum salinum]
MSVNRATGACMFCGGSGAEKTCGHCDGGYHIACARKRGNLRVEKHGNGIVSSARLNYDWECPNCGETARGEM